MYLMGRERRVSFVLSSHARFLSGAHEGQWVQYYIYCQNDPVSLIDPTGYSPENTGTPIRFTPKNYSNIQSSEGGMNSCYMEDYTLVVAAVQNPDGSNINMAEAGRQAAWRDAEHRRNEHQDLLIEGMFGSNDGCNAYWTEIWIDVYGVRIEYNKDGSIRDVFPLDDNSPKNRQIAYGIRDALNELKDQGVKFSLKEIQVLLHDVEEFGNKYLTGLEKRFGKAFETRTLVKHIVMAGAIKQHINVEPDAQPNGDFTRYDMEIAFWASFLNEAYRMSMDFNKTVDFALFIKAKAMTETRYSHTDPKNPNEIFRHSHEDYGLLAINDTSEKDGANSTWEKRFGIKPFQSGDVKNIHEPLWNVGAAMTLWLGKLAKHMTGNSENIRNKDLSWIKKASYDDWYCAEAYYGPHKNPPGNPYIASPDNLTDHARLVRNRFLHYKNQRRR